MRTTKTFNVQIWVGLRIRYTESICSLNQVEVICDEFVTEVKDCVTITPTNFRYVDGNEPGVIVGYINYPRFPHPDVEIINRALELARRLKIGLCQNRVSVVTPNTTYLLEDENS